MNDKLQKIEARVDAMTQGTLSLTGVGRLYIDQTDIAMVNLNLPIEEVKANVAFFLTAPADVRYLLAEVERLQGNLNRSINVTTAYAAYVEACLLAGDMPQTLSYFAEKRLRAAKSEAQS